MKMTPNELHLRVRQALHDGRRASIVTGEGMVLAEFRLDAGGAVVESEVDRAAYGSPFGRRCPHCNRYPLDKPAAKKEAT